MGIVFVNGLTLSRIPLSLLFCILVLQKPDSYFTCIILFVLIAASDYLDGKLARKYGVQTRTGAKLDVIADFFFIISSCSALCFRSLLPLWMVLVMILKFSEFLITSEIARKSSKGVKVFLFDPIGRLAAVLFYLLPLLALLQSYIPSHLRPHVIAAVCGVISVLAALSSLLRLMSLMKREDTDAEKAS